MNAHLEFVNKLTGMVDEKGRAFTEEVLKVLRKLAAESRSLSEFLNKVKESRELILAKAKAKGFDVRKLALGLGREFGQLK